MTAIAAGGLSLALFGAALFAADVQQETRGPEASAPGETRWAIGRSGLMCALRRQLAASPTVTLIVRAFPGSGQYEVMLVSPEWSRTMARGRSGARLTLVPNGTHYERPRFVNTTAGEFGNGVRFAALPASFMADMESLEAISLTVDDRQVGTYAVPLAARAAQAFSECETAQLAEWGADPAGLEAGATRPRPLGEHIRWLEPQEFPAPGNAVRMVFRLNLDAEGRVQQCAMIDSNLAARQGERACERLAERARYEPARDARGNAVPSIAVHQADWIRAPSVD